MSDLVGNPEDRFSHNEAHIMSLLMRKVVSGSDQALDYVRNCQSGKKQVLIILSVYPGLSCVVYMEGYND